MGPFWGLLGGPFEGPFGTGSERPRRLGTWREYVNYRPDLTLGVSFGSRKMAGVRQIASRSHFGCVCHLAAVKLREYIK